MAQRPKEKSRIFEGIASLVGVPASAVTMLRAFGSDSGLSLAAAGHRFCVEEPGSSGVGPIAGSAEKAKAAAKSAGKRAIPIVVVPFMGELGKRACEEAGVSWFDLSGNAHIVATGLRIIVDGRPNRFLHPGRPANLFAPKSSRVVRWLLMNPGKAVTQREIAQSTGMTEGFVSRIASRLEQDSYLLRDKNGAIQLKNPELAMNAWRESYQFAKHNVIEGHVAARSGDALASFVSAQFAEERLAYAATGLAAAWQYSKFAAFRVATFFLKEPLTEATKEKFGLREESRGANLWLVEPNDEGVFLGVREQNGVVCVHPLQAYLDLKAHPERATEAAERLRTEYLTWNHNG